MKKNGKILILEPNNGLLTALGFLLKRHFEQVQTIDNIQQAEGILALDDFDVVLMDLDLFKNKSEAAQTVAAIKQNKANPEVVLLSTFAQVPIAAEAVENGAFDFVHKPWNETEIAISVSNAIFKKSYLKRIKELEQEIENFNISSSAQNIQRDSHTTSNNNQHIQRDNYDGIEQNQYIIRDNFGIETDETLEAIEQRVIKSVMLRNRGNISLTAQQLGITRQTLYNKLKRGK